VASTEKNARAAWGRQKDQQKFQAALAEFQENLREKTQTKLAQYQNQLRLNELAQSHEYNLALQEYRHSCDAKLAELNDRLTTARQKDQQTFTQALQWELAVFQRETNRELALFQSKLAFKQRWSSDLLEQLKSRLLVHPINILRSHYQRLINNQVIPLIVLTSPPAIRADKVETDRSPVSLKQVEDRLLQSNRDFLEKHYAFDSPIRPVEHLGGAWKTRGYYAEAGVKDLHALYSAIPTLFLESSVSGDELIFSIAFWFPNYAQLDYKYKTIFTTNYVAILCHFAKLEAAEWALTRRKYIDAGKSEEEIAQKNPIAESNLRAIREEEEDKSLGVDRPVTKYGYKLDNATQHFCDFLAVCHQIAIALMADIYHLLYSLPETEGKITKPLLPQLLPDLLNKIPRDLPGSVIRDLLEAITLNYRRAYDALGEELQAWIPELSLELAMSLSAFDDKSWSMEQAIKSLREWLKQKGVAGEELELDSSEFFSETFSTPDRIELSEELNTRLDQLESVVMAEDKPYVGQLNKCLKAVGSDRRVSIAKAAYQRGVRQYRQRSYLKAIESLNLALKFGQNIAETFFYRGLSYAGLQSYQQAINDYWQALEFQPQWEVKVLEALVKAYEATNNINAAIAIQERLLNLGGES
jgi:hypothetical protein